MVRENVIRTLKRIENNILHGMQKFVFRKELNMKLYELTSSIMKILNNK